MVLYAQLQARQQLRNVIAWMGGLGSIANDLDLVRIIVKTEHVLLRITYRIARKTIKNFIEVAYVNTLIFHRCQIGYTGTRCDKPDENYIETTGKIQDSTNKNSGSILTGLLIFFGLLLIMAALIAGYIFYRRNKTTKAFIHERLDDNNLEISNPMYMNGDIEDEGDPMDREFTLDPEKV